MESKRGTHVGIVLSFIIFITFIVFLLAVLQPAIKTKTSKQALLDFLKEDLTAWVSTNLTTVSVVITGTVPQSCLKLNDLISETGIDTTIIVINDSGNTFDSYLIGSGNSGLLIDRTGSETSFFKIKVSEEFASITLDPGLTGCGNLNEGNGYTIGSVIINEYIFESKIESLLDEYKNDYKNVKNELKISSENNFGFSFTYANGTVVKTKELNVSTSVFAEDFPIRYTDKFASRVSGLINIRIW